MATSHRQEEYNQTEPNGNKTRAPPFDSSSSQRFQKITQKIISRGVDHHNASNLHRSNATSKDSHKSIATVVAPPCDDGNRRFSHHGASTTNRLAANSNVTHQNFTLDHRLRQTVQASHPVSAKDIPDHASFSDHDALVSKNGSAGQLTSSSIKVSHNSSPHQKANNPSYTNAAPFISSVVQNRSSSGKLARTSSEMNQSSFAGDKSVTRKGRTATKDLAGNLKRQNELCKDCKTSIMESVCFINNDGKISASLTGAVSARSLHYCTRPGCAANRGYNYPSASPLSNKALPPKKQVPLTHTNTTSHNSEGLGDHLISVGSSPSSLQGSKYNRKHQDLIKINEKVRRLERDGESWVTDTDSHSVVSHHQSGVHTSSSCNDAGDVLDGFPHIEDHPCSLSQQEEGNQQSYGENGKFYVENGTPAVSCICSDIIHNHNDDDDDHDEMSSINKDAIDELHDFKSFCYHGDNEYSCSEDGTDATTTPNSLIKGAFDRLSNLDHIEEHSEDKPSQMKRSSMARMRQKYLESLREQEAEMVRLRKQEIMARKQAGDWMLDCHMEELLHRLAPNGEARVKVLVEAFETIIHHSDSESSQTHHQEQNHLHDDQGQLDNMHSTDSSS